MTVKEYAEKLEVARELFYSEDSMFGIYSCKPVHYNKEIVNKWGNLSIQGTTRRLAVGDSYEIKFEGAYTHQKYGDFYKIVEVEAESLNTISDQDKFLKAVLADNHFKSLKDAYPNDKLVDLIMSENGIDVSKTKGIKKKTLAKIKDTVEKNAGVSVLIAKLHNLNLSVSRIERVMKHFGNAEKAIKAIDENIFNLCELPHFGFLTVDKIAIQELGLNPTNENRIIACINYLLKKDNQDGHTFSIKGDVLTEALEMLDINEELIVEVLENMNNNKQYYVSGSKIAFSSIYDKEVSIYKHLKRIRDSYIAPDISEIEERIFDVEMRQGFKFTDEQRNSIIEGSQDGVMVLNGVAGSGKTATIKGLLDSLGNDNVISAALSGKAVQVLRNRSIEASTIHRMLKYDPVSKGFYFNEYTPLPYDAIVLDESSMINVDLFHSVIQAVKDGSKLIITGDNMQLPCIGYGDVLTDLLNTEEFPKYELSQVHRQAAKSGILSLASDVRSGKQIMPYNSSGKEVYGELQDQTAISYESKERILPDILHIARSYKSRVKTPQDLLDFQVIVSNRERGAVSVRNLNTKLQEIFNNTNKPALNRNGYNYFAGDKVIAIGNSYDVYVFNDEFEFFDYQEDEESVKPRLGNVYNGTMGYVHDVNVKSKTIFFKFEGIDGIIPYSQEDLDRVELGYAITVHRSQGSGFPFLLFALDFSAYTLLSRQLIYTGLTRGSKKSAFLFENNACHKALTVDISATRRTFLREIINESIEVS